jgi:predicted transcriptional regulator
MADEAPSLSVNRQLTTEIVAAYVRRNQLGADQLASLISTVHQAFSGLGKRTAGGREERTPAVPIRQSVHRDYVVLPGMRLARPDAQTGSRTGHESTVEQYRDRWNLTREHPMTAPSYSERRSTFALEFGLGRTRGGSAETRSVPEAVAEMPPPSSPKRRGRARMARS